MSDTCAHFTYFAASDRCHGYSSCNALDAARCFGTCFSGDEVCTEEEECVRPGKCENTAVVDARAEATLSDCAQFMNRRPDANFFSYDVDTQVSRDQFKGSPQPIVVSAAQQSLIPFLLVSGVCPYLRLLPTWHCSLRGVLLWRQELCTA